MLRAIAVAFSLVGCAGPATPFGAVNGWGERITDKMARWLAEIASEERDGIHRRQRVRFTPERQILHGRTDFSIIIEDPDGIPEEFELKLFYNGMDMSRRFLSQAEPVFVEPLRRRLQLRVRHLRLLPSRTNRVHVIYRRGPLEPPVHAQYLAPTCSAFETVRALASVPGFELSPDMIQLINDTALENNFNPHFLAGLIAQESAFNPRAVSYRKALGLTQITDLGESEVIKRYSSWPRYVGVSQMPFPVLKLAILNGEVHAGNEWRLNPALSIQGGVEYLTYLSEYWSRPEKRLQVEKHLGDSDTVVSEVILASYNSGAARVSQALERQGARWLDDEELREARKYVGRVVSYCDHFALEEE